MKNYTLYIKDHAPVEISFKDKTRIEDLIKVSAGLLTLKAEGGDVLVLLEKFIALIPDKDQDE